MGNTGKIQIVATDVSEKHGYYFDRIIGYKLHMLILATDIAEKHG